jgi:hypothetical protein
LIASLKLPDVLESCECCGMLAKPTPLATENGDVFLCGRCQAATESHVQCETCEGFGQVCSDCGYSEKHCECEDVFGTAWESCEVCDGSGLLDATEET